MFRFLIKSKIEDPQNIIITDKEIVHKIIKVLRLKTGDVFVLFDLEANEYEVVIKSLDKKAIVCSYLNKSFTERELSIEINLYQSLLKKDKLEWLCQKVTEMGVKKIIPVISENCVIKELNPNKAKRYQKIIEEATLQSGGKITPLFAPVIDFATVVTQLNQRHLNLIAHEQETDSFLLKVLKDKSNKVVNLFIGPEGGFSSLEIDLARRNSLITVSLGKRILRAETAAMVACATVTQLANSSY